MALSWVSEIVQFLCYYKYQYKFKVYGLDLYHKMNKRCHKVAFLFN